MLQPLAATAAYSPGVMACLASWAMETTAPHSAPALSLRWQVRSGDVTVAVAG
jgi:hypothetical protein